MRFRYRGWNLIAEADIDRQLRGHLPVVLHKSRIVFHAPAKPLGQRDVCVRGSAKIKAGKAEAGVGVDVRGGWPTGGAGGEIEFARGSGKDVDVELLQPRLAAELEAVASALPGNDIIVLISIVREEVGSVAG